jgi:hypothetical protein
MDDHIIILEGKVYMSVKDDGGIESCKNCSFRNNSALCHEANRLIKCDNDTPLHFVRSEGVDLRSSTEQMKSWEPTSTITMHENQPIGTKYDQDKLQYSLIPSHALEQIAKNLTVGLKKYKERDNWKKVDGAEQRYLDALYRHLEAHRRGELYDTDSSVPDMLHMAAVAVNAMFLLEFMLDPKLNKKEK